jgi:hypothetical protein
MSRMGSNLFTSASCFFLCSIGRAGARKTRRLILLISVGWLPPYVHPSGACLNRGTRVPFGIITPPRVPPNRGCVSSDKGWKPFTCVPTLRPLYAFGDPATCLAMAHMKALHSRAMATTTGLAFLPLAMSWRYRVQSRTWACQLMAWITVGSFSSRSWGCRLTLAG